MDAAKQIDAYLTSLRDWRGRELTKLRGWIRSAEPELEESWKWGTPVFSRGGNVLAIGAFAGHVKISFFDGAALSDPARLFNAGLEAKRSRAIDLHEGESLDRAAFQALVRAAAAKPSGKAAARAPASKSNRK